MIFSELIEPHTEDLSEFEVHECVLSHVWKTGRSLAEFSRYPFTVQKTDLHYQMSAYIREHVENIALNIRYLPLERYSNTWHAILD